jgi:hypothetical protein
MDSDESDEFDTNHRELRGARKYFASVRLRPTKTHSTPNLRFYLLLTTSVEFCYFERHNGVMNKQSQNTIIDYHTVYSSLSFLLTSNLSLSPYRCRDSSLYSSRLVLPKEVEYIQCESLFPPSHRTRIKPVPPLYITAPSIQFLWN